MQKLTTFLKTNSEKFQKLSIVGIHSFNRIKLSMKIRKLKLRKNLHWKIINDFQEAKEWIVSNKIK